MNVNDKTHPYRMWRPVLGVSCKGRSVERSGLHGNSVMDLLRFYFKKFI